MGPALGVGMGAVKGAVASTCTIVNIDGVGIYTIAISSTFRIAGDVVITLGICVIGCRKSTGAGVPCHNISAYCEKCTNKRRHGA